MVRDFAKQNTHKRHDAGRRARAADIYRRADIQVRLIDRTLFDVRMRMLCVCDLVVIVVAVVIVVVLVRSRNPRLS